MRLEKLFEKVLLVYTLCASKKEAEKIARECVKARVAACANAFAPAKSFYYWKGKFVQAKEFPVFLKTTRSKYAALEKKVLQLHSYELPCVVALPIEKGSRAYLQWVEKEGVRLT